MQYPYFRINFHIGPRKQYSTENWKKNGVARLGTMGEYVVPFLALEGEKMRVPDEMCLETGKTNRLIDQVSAWMAEISPGIRISAELLPTIEKAKLAIRYSGDRFLMHFCQPMLDLEFRMFCLLLWNYLFQVKKAFY